MSSDWVGIPKFAPEKPGAVYVELIDGQVVASDAEEWRHECECKAIAAMPLERRRAWLADLEKKRGVPAVDRIRDTLKQLWEARHA